MSEFVFLLRTGTQQVEAAMGTPERAAQSMQRWLAWLRELEAKGQLAAPGQPLAMAGRVVRGANGVITDGPYAEAKDLVLGFIVIEARDLDEAAQIARGCPIAQGGGSVEVRPVGHMPEHTPEGAAQ